MNEDLRTLLTDCLNEIGGACEDSIYGAACTDDPSEFHPDHESNTAEEIANWEADLKAHKAGLPIERGHEHKHIKNEKGEVIGWTSTYRWGLGVTTVTDPKLCDLRDRLLAFLNEEPS